MNEKKVKLVAWLQNPKENWDAEDPASCGARGCFSELSSEDIHKQEILKEDYEQRKETIFKETSGRGHGSVLDQSGFCFSIDNLTRASTLFLCAPEYAAHEQQSLRRATAQRGFYTSDFFKKIGAHRLMGWQFRLYDKMQKAGIPSEDARYILPLNTKTTIQTLVDARELMHLDLISQKYDIPFDVRDTVNRMMKQAIDIAPRLMKNRENNYEELSWFPSSHLFSPENKEMQSLITTFGGENVNLIDNCGIPLEEETIKKAVEEKDLFSLSMLKHFHFTFLVPMSLASFHQATRQRTWNQTVEPLVDAVDRGIFVCPPSIKGTEFEKEYNQINQTAKQLVLENKDNPDIYGVLPHSLQVYDLIHINGWNAVNSIGKRTCTKAQWEIRNYSNEIASYIKQESPELGKYCAPQGIIYGYCPEKEPCGLCKKILKK